MKKSIKIITLALAAFIGLGALIPVPAFAEATSDVCSLPESSNTHAVRESAGCNGTANGLPTVIKSIISAIIAVLGLVAVIYIIIGGVNYMTANGDTSKLEKAKKTILYALIGLVVSALAFVIVQFAITTVANA